MTPEQFIAKWSANQRAERAASQEHFIDLCNLLGEPTPNTDPTGATYAFEKGATKATRGEGWADVWKRGCFGWEYKGKHKDLDAAHKQLLLYAGALENPPLLIVSDIERIIIRTNWTNAVSERHDLTLEDLREPAKRALLKAIFSDPDRLRPAKTRTGLTEDAASEFAELAKRLRGRGHEAQAVAHFIQRLVFCLFADDVGLLPAGLFERMIAAALNMPARFTDYAARLFKAMKDPGGEIDFTPVQWFNGGLFDDDTALPLEKEDIALLGRVAALDWSEIDPSILGTLFERGLDPDKRSQLGAHYTDRDKIEVLVNAAVRRPLLGEWAATKEKIQEALDREDAAKTPRTRKKAATDAGDTYRRFLDRVRAFRVLDPACGSGNFLYLSLLALKDLELLVSVEAEAMGLPREFPQVGPEAVKGIEINPYAAELARVSVWIGHIQWARRNGLPAPSNPVLKPLDNIECRDAVLTADGKRAAWPKADAIIGNPPFLGNKSMIGTLGAEYTAALRTAYADQLPGGVDLVCYWFSRACDELEAGRTQRVGLVATQSIRKGTNRSVLDRILEIGRVYEAMSDEEWTVDGADVRVSLVCFSKESNSIARLDGAVVPLIHADLTASTANMTEAQRLSENIGLCFQGPVKVGPFDVPGATARKWLQAPSNANGRPNSDVVRPWMNGQDVTRRPSDTWIVDFADRSHDEAAFFALPFAHVLREVKPERDRNADRQRRERWWMLGRSGADLRSAMAPLSRFIATPRVAKHRLFVWCHRSVLPDSRLYAIARDDDVTFGILHSRIHEVWSLANASRHGVGNDPTYNNQTCFETFPFPEGLTPNQPAARYAGDAEAQAIASASVALVTARDRWLNPSELVNWVPEIVQGLPARAVAKDAVAASALKKRTLTELYNMRGKAEGAWLDSLHAALDKAVAASYGWQPGLSNEEILENLLALNRARASLV